MVAAEAGLVEVMETVNGQIAIVLGPGVTRRGPSAWGLLDIVFQGLLAMLKMHQMRRQCECGGWRGWIRYSTQAQVRYNSTQY